MLYLQDLPPYICFLVYLAEKRESKTTIGSKQKILVIVFIIMVSTSTKRVLPLLKMSYYYVAS